MPRVSETLARAQAYHLAGQLTQAEQAYLDVLQADSGHAEAHAQFGRVLTQLGKWDEAVSSFQQACRLRPESAEMSQNLRHALSARDNRRGGILAQQGKLIEAAACYCSALRLQPDFVAAHGNLGIVLRQQGRLDEAAACYQRVLELDPSRAEAHNDLGLTRQQQGNFEEATRHYRRALELRPDFMYAHNNLGGLFAKQNKLDEAIACYRQALALKPDSAEAHCNLGLALSKQDKLDEAVACFRQALLLKPDFAEAYCHLALALAKQNMPDEALACYRQVVTLMPDRAEAHNDLGIALMDANRLDEAVACYGQALSLKPDHAEAHYNLGLALTEQNKLDEAVACHQKALTLKPGYAEAHNSLGLALAKQKKLDEAVACYRRALALKSDSVLALNNLGNALVEQGQFDEGLACYERALELDPYFADGHYNRSQVLLLLGRLTEGWMEYEWRWKCNGKTEPPLQEPRWTGTPLTGRTILLRSEQGLGDVLQFIRYAELVKQQAARVLVECQPQLVRLLATCPGVDHVVAIGQPPGEFDFHIPLMSLPAAFRTSLENIPAKTPYLWPGPELANQWKAELDKNEGFKIGIAWQGSKIYRRDHERSIPLAQFAAIPAIPGVVVYSLQMGAGREQLIELGDRAPIIDLGDRLGDFYSTAAIICNLDLVIAPDSSAAHLAGALGVPVWVPLHFAPEWRWMLEREDSPWYPTMRLFRQSRPGDWDAVFQRIEDELAKIVNGFNSHRGPARAGQGKSIDAEACCGHVLELTPNNAEAHNDLGVMCQRQGKFVEAMGHYRRALELRPDFAYAHHNFADLLAEQHKLDEAVTCYRQALALKPDFPEAQNDMGVALVEGNRLDEAVACYRQAIVLRPEYAEAHFNLGLALMKQNKLDEAVACYRQSLVLKPDYADAHTSLGLALAEAHQLDEAAECLQRALTLQPEYAKAHYNLGLVLATQNKLDEAVACYRTALALKPDYAEAHNNLGVALMDGNRLDEAIACYQRVLTLDSGFAEAHYNRALALLMMGRFSEAWPGYEWRWKGKGTEEPVLPQPRWTGARLAGKTILLHSEQGLGDTLQFVRYAELAKQQGGRVILACHSSLVSLLASCAGVDAVIAPGQPLSKFDLHAPLLSLPGIFGTTLETLPAKVPYLSPDAGLIAQWKHKLGASRVFKIGIAWQGSLTHLKDRLRSIPLAHFAGIARIGGVHVYSLQMGPGHEQLTELGQGSTITDLNGRPGDFHETAAIVRNLDLVITCDSAPAHLAGALAVPVWVALPFAADWRWMLERADSPWYPTMRLFRQSRPGDWDGVFQRIEKDLARIV